MKGISNQFSLGPGSYEVLIDPVYTEIKITKVSDIYYSIPKHNFWERLKYLVTGKLQGAELKEFEIK